MCPLHRAVAVYHMDPFCSNKRGVVVAHRPWLTPDAWDVVTLGSFHDSFDCCAVFGRGNSDFVTNGGNIRSASQDRKARRGWIPVL